MRKDKTRQPAAIPAETKQKTEDIPRSLWGIKVEKHQEHL